MRPAVGLALILLAVFAIDPAVATTTDVRHDVYIWQRHWTPAVRDALAASRDVFGGVRVLVAQAGRGDRWATSDVTPRDFDGDTRPLIAVVRYDGAGDAPDVFRLDAFLRERLGRWREAGHPFAGVEIDYDCGSRELVDYARRLRELRRSLPPDVALSVTALPAWIGSAGLDSVVDAVDETVLQLHAISNPMTSDLFDDHAAEQAARAFARHVTKLFRIALPAYGYRVTPTDNGRAYAVEAEMPVDAAASANAHELVADPRKVSRALRSLEADPPTRWRGVAWFRLPVEGDRRAWTLSALRDVIAGRVPEAKLAPLAVVRGNGATDLFVVNDGDADAMAPALHASADRCADADTTSGWTLGRDSSALRFAPVADARIHAHSRVAIGWLRCDGEIHVRLDTD